MTNEIRIWARSQLEDLVARVAAGYTPTREDCTAAARFLICISAPRRNAKARAEMDAREGLRWLMMAGIEVPAHLEVGHGYLLAARVREWFEERFPCEIPF